MAGSQTVVRLLGHRRERVALNLLLLFCVRGTVLAILVCLSGDDALSLPAEAGAWGRSKKVLRFISLLYAYRER